MRQERSFELQRGGSWEIKAAKGLRDNPRESYIVGSWAKKPTTSS